MEKKIRFWFERRARTNRGGWRRGVLVKTGTKHYHIRTFCPAFTRWRVMQFPIEHTTIVEIN